jgi:hypothetical protein
MSPGLGSDEDAVENQDQNVVRRDDDDTGAMKDEGVKNTTKQTNFDVLDEEGHAAL